MRCPRWGQWLSSFSSRPRGPCGYRLKPHANSIKHLKHRGEFRRCFVFPIQARAREASGAGDVCDPAGTQNVRDGTNNKLVVAGFERLGEIVADHLRVIEMACRVERFDLNHVVYPSNSSASAKAFSMSLFCEALLPPSSMT